MNLSRALACVVAAIAVTAPAGAAAAGTPPEGRRCTFLASSSHVEDEGHDGQINGGPLAAPGSEISIRCSIHVGNATHSGPAAVSESAGPARDVVALPPTPMSYLAAHDDVVATCTEATVDGTTWYWDTTAWTTDPDAPCDVSRTVTIWPPECPDHPVCAVEDVLPLLPPPVRGVVDYVGCIVLGGPGLCSFDYAVCPLLAALAPGVPGALDVRPDGDVYVGGEFFWDCPPYEW